MQPSPTPRRTTRPSRAALAVASLAAAAALAVPVAGAGLGWPGGATIAGAPLPAPVAGDAAVVDPRTGERVVVDTVYVVSSDPVLLAAAPAGGEEHERDGLEEHEGEGEDD